MTRATAPEQVWHEVACQYARLWARACTGAWARGDARAIKFNRALCKLAIAAVGVSQCLFQLQSAAGDGDDERPCCAAPPPPPVWGSVQAMLRADVPSTEKALRMFADDEDNADCLRASAQWWDRLVPLSSAGETAASAGANARTFSGPADPQTPYRADLPSSVVPLEWLAPVVGELSGIRNPAHLDTLLDYFRVVEVVAQEGADVQSLLDFTVYIFLVVKVMHMERLPSGEWAPARVAELAAFARDDTDNSTHRQHQYKLGPAPLAV